MRRLGRAVAVGLALAAGVVLVAGGRVEAADRATLSAAQQQAAGQASQPLSGPTIQVYSRETSVDVTVTDDSGKPVRGLTKADFTVEQDGKAQVIRSFKEGGLEAEPARPKLPPGVYSNAGAVPANGPVTVLLMNFLTNRQVDMIRAKTATVEYLKTMPAGTEVAVFALSANVGARLVQSFTTDGAAAAEKVEKLEVEWVTRPGYMIEYDLMSYDEMNQILSYVSGIKGRKNLVMFGFVALPLAVPHGRTRNLTYGQIQELIDRLVAAQVAIYPVNPRGVGPMTPMPGVVDTFGGESYSNSNDLKALLTAAVDNGRSYYTLTYIPPAFAMDTRLHTIEVKVDRPGVHLSYRKGFNAEEPPEAAAAPTAPKMMQAAMLGGAPPATEILFDVQVEPGTQAAKLPDSQVMGLLDVKLRKDPLTRFGFLYTLPMNQIAFADGPGGTHNGALEFDVTALDANGKLVTMLSQTMKMPLTGEEYGEFIQTPFHFFQQIDLPAGTWTVRVGVLDSVGNKVGTVEIPLTVAKGMGAVVAGK